MTLTEVKQVMRYHLVGGEGTEDEEQVPGGWRRGVMRMGRWGKEDHRCSETETSIKDGTVRKESSVRNTFL